MITPQFEAALKKANEAAIAYAKITTNPEHKAILYSARTSSIPKGMSKVFSGTAESAVKFLTRAG